MARRMTGTYSAAYAYCAVTAIRPSDWATRELVTLACGAEQLMAREYARPRVLGQRVKCAACTAARSAPGKAAH